MRQRVKNIKFLTKLICSLVFVSSALAEETGYKEAMEYFKHRKVASEKSKTKGLFKKRRKQNKFSKDALSFGLTYGDVSKSERTYSGAHFTYIQKTHPLLRQSLSFEYEESEEIERFSLFQSLYYDRYNNWGPELGFGAGREFGSLDDLSFIAVKLGLSLVDRFGGLLDVRFFFKQEVYFKKSLQSQSLGASLYLKF